MNNCSPVCTRTIGIRAGTLLEQVDIVLLVGFKRGQAYQGNARHDLALRPQSGDPPGLAALFT